MTKLQKNKSKDLASKVTLTSKLYAFWDFWGPIFFTLCLYFGIRYYIAEARYIPSGSMLPTLKINDRLLIEKLTYKRRSPRRGEIVVFNSPYSFDKVLLSQRLQPLPSSIQCSLVGLPVVSYIPGFSDPACNAYIKRVVAIPGDDVLIKTRGEVIVNGRLIEESYVKNFCKLSHVNLIKCNSLQSQVPEGHVLVLGDNRMNSWDGRYWPGGALLPEREIIGRAIWRFWPLNRVGILSP